MIRQRPRVTARAGRVLLIVVAGSCLIGGTPGAAVGQEQTTPAFGGIQGRAAGSGLHAFYNVGGLLPIASPVDLGVPDALATVASGPTTYARASVADPGDLLANPDALLALFSTSYKAGTIPPYPYRVSATSGVGEPTAESSPAPGLNARVTADQGGSTAVATMPALEGGAVATARSMVSRATTKVDASSVTTRLRTVISGFDLLGVFRVDSVVTDLTAKSDGTKTTLSGGTVVTGATMLGQAVTIDASGVHTKPGEQGTPLLAGAANVMDALANAGIHVTFAGPVKLPSGTAGQLATDGLRIDLEFSDHTLPVLGTLLSAVPKTGNPVPGAPGLDDILVAVRARNLVALELGRGIVSLTTRPGFRAPDAAFGGAVPEIAPGTPGISGGLAPSFASPGGVGGGSSSGVSGLTPALTRNVPRATFGAGVGALLLLVLLAQPFVGAAVARFASGVLGTDGTDACPGEER